MKAPTDLCSSVGFLYQKLTKLCDRCVRIVYAFHWAEFVIWFSLLEAKIKLVIRFNALRFQKNSNYMILDGSNRFNVSSTTLAIQLLAAVE